jgi:hypothetical protein
MEHKDEESLIEEFLLGSNQQFAAEFVREIIQQSFACLGLGQVKEIDARLNLPMQAFNQMVDHPTFCRYIFFVLLRAFPIARDNLRNAMSNKERFDSFCDYMILLLAGIECSNFYAFNALAQVNKIVDALQVKWMFPNVELIPRSIVPLCNVYKDALN